MIGGARDRAIQQAGYISCAFVLNARFSLLTGVAFLMFQSPIQIKNDPLQCGCVCTAKVKCSFMQRGKIKRRFIT